MSFQLVLTCPLCGGHKWDKFGDKMYRCEKCGYLAYSDDMNLEIREDVDTISVPINGGTLVAGKGCDPEYPAVYIAYRTENYCEIDLAIASTYFAEGGKDVTVYTFDDVYSEDYQRKFIIRKKDIDIAVGDDENA